jgi:hypothetical protein
LYQALLHIRKLEEETYLWVDQISINKGDDEEKGHQVRQMSKVYANAEEVLVWLGSNSDGADTERLVVMFNWIDEMAIRARKNWKDSCRDLFRQYQRDFQVRSLQTEKETLAKILQRKWFERVWILQEVAMARRATLMCGDYCFPARTFAFMPLLLEVEPNKSAESVLAIMPKRRNDEDRSLRKLWVKFFDSKATDARDKVFALLAMSEDAFDWRRFEPSYKKEEDQVRRDTASFFLFGEVLGIEYAFPKIELEDLTLPITELIEKILTWTLGREYGDEAASKTAKLLIGLINRGQLSMKDLLMSLARKNGQYGQMAQLLDSRLGFVVGVEFQNDIHVLRVASIGDDPHSVRLIYSESSR